MTKPKPPFTVAFIPDRWEGGVDGLTHDAEYVYFRLCKRMWTTGDGVPVDDGPAVCRFFKGYGKALVELIRKEKIEELDGKLCNERAISEHWTAVEKKDTATARGKAGAEARKAARAAAQAEAQARAQANAQGGAQAPLKHHSSGSLPDPDPLTTISTPPSSASGPASEPAAETRGPDEAGQIVVAFDAALEVVYGPKRRAWPASKDYTTAQRLLAAGLVPSAAQGIFEAILRPMLARRRDAPRTLAYVEAAVPEHLAELQRPLPTAAPAAEGDQGFEYDPHNWRLRVSTFKQTGKWLRMYGPKPGEPDCDVPIEVLREFGYVPEPAGV